MCLLLSTLSLSALAFEIKTPPEIGTYDIQPISSTVEPGTCSYQPGAPLQAAFISWSSFIATSRAAGLTGQDVSTPELVRDAKFTSTGDSLFGEHVGQPIEFELVNSIQDQMDRSLKCDLHFLRMTTGQALRVNDHAAQFPGHELIDIMVLSSSDDGDVIVLAVPNLDQVTHLGFEIGAPQFDMITVAEPLMPNLKQLVWYSAQLRGGPKGAPGDGLNAREAQAIATISPEAADMVAEGSGEGRVEGARKAIGSSVAPVIRDRWLVPRWFFEQHRDMAFGFVAAMFKSMESTDDLMRANANLSDWQEGDQAWREALAFSSVATLGVNDVPTMDAFYWESQPSFLKANVGHYLSDKGEYTRDSLIAKLLAAMHRYGVISRSDVALPHAEWDYQQFVELGIDPAREVVTVFDQEAIARLLAQRGREGKSDAGLRSWSVAFPENEDELPDGYIAELKKTLKEPARELALYPTAVFEISARTETKGVIGCKLVHLIEGVPEEDRLQPFAGYKTEDWCSDVKTGAPIILSQAQLERMYEKATELTVDRAEFVGELILEIAADEDLDIKPEQIVTVGYGPYAAEEFARNPQGCRERRPNQEGVLFVGDLPIHCLPRDEDAKDDSRAVVLALKSLPVETGADRSAVLDSVPADFGLE